MTQAERVDVDALLAEVRERVRRKREEGLYTQEVDDLLATSLPGGRLFVDELAEPMAALPRHLGTEIPYDPRSQKPVLGVPITFARKGLMSMLRWWIQAIVDRQNHVNRLIVRKLEDLDERASPLLETRVRRLEERVRRLEEGMHGASEGDKNG